MVALVFQHPAESFDNSGFRLSVVCGGAVLGHIARDPFRPVYRYFPGADNNVAFLLEHAELEELKRNVEGLCAEPAGRRWALLGAPLPPGRERTPGCQDALFPSGAVGRPRVVVTGS